MANPVGPTPCDVLASLCKFAVISKAAPGYYATHWEAVDRAFAGMQVIADGYEPLQIAFARSLPLELGDGAARILTALRESNVPEEHVQWMSDEMVQIALAVLPLARDPKLPKWLEASGRVVRDYLAEDGGR